MRARDVPGVRLLQQVRCGAAADGASERNALHGQGADSAAEDLGGVVLGLHEPAKSREEARLLRRRERDRQWRKANPDKVRAQRRRWKEAHPGAADLDNSACYGRRRRSCFLTAPVAAADTCAICASGPGTSKLASDHDHSTGSPRGRLCQTCNSRRVGELESATLPTILYLARHGSDALTRLMAAIVEAQLTIAKEDAAYAAR